MKTLFSLLIMLFTFINVVKASDFTIAISGTSYNPNELIAYLGDKITISANISNPLVQVDKATWDANDATPSSNGWGIVTSDYQFTITRFDTIYFVCNHHVSSGMKGRIIIEFPLNINRKRSDLTNILIYPNPLKSKGIIAINSNLPISSVKIFNCIGKEIKTLTPNNDLGLTQISLDITDLANGSYFAVISDEKKQYVKQFAILK